MAQLDEFLAHTIEGYLFRDIDTLRSRANRAAGERFGACGYPLLMSVFGGIELLGALSSFQPYQDKGQSNLYFADYWENYLYPQSPEREAGKGVYFLARNGIAHSFGVKGLISVVKDESPPTRHLTYTGSEVVIDSGLLAQSLLDSYPRWKVDALAPARRPTVEQRLTEVLASNEHKVNVHAKFFKSLPPPKGPPPTYPGVAPASGTFGAKTSPGSNSIPVPPVNASSNPFKT